MATKYFNGKPLVVAGGTKAGPIKMNNETDDARVYFNGTQAQGSDPVPVVQPQPTQATAPATQPTPVLKMPETPAPQPTKQANPQPTAQPVSTPAPVLKQATAPAAATTPTAAIGSGQMAQDLWQRATTAMNNPSRYDADLVKQGAQVIEDSIARMRKSGMRSIGENMASRGLLGSSLEAETNAGLEGQLQEQARAGLFNLQREQANTYGADRNSAFGQGYNAAGMNQNQYFGERNANRMDTQLAGDFADRFGPTAVPGYSGQAAGTPLSEGYFGQTASAPAAVGPGSAMPGTSGEYGPPVLKGALGPLGGLFGGSSGATGSASNSDPNVAAGYDVGAWNALPESEKSKYFANGGAPAGYTPGEAGQPGTAYDPYFDPYNNQFYPQE